MSFASDRQMSAGNVNYDEAPIVQTRIEGVDYRLDTGFGSAVAVSTRAEGSWAWAPLVEARWDGTSLKAKGLDHSVRTLLGAALAEAMNGRDEAGA